MRRTVEVSTSGLLALLLLQFGLFAAVIWRAVYAQSNNVLLIEECASHRLPWPCPVDCAPVVSPAGCASCSCPSGPRCPVVVCPDVGARCARRTKADHCDTCLCRGDTWSIVDAFNNVETFFVDRPIPGSLERCRMADVDRVSRCTSATVEFINRALAGKGSDLAMVAALAPWLLFTEAELSSICATVSQLPACVGHTRFNRCVEQHGQLAYLMDTYALPCLEQRDAFARVQPCAANVLVGHTVVAECGRRLSRMAHVASAGNESLAQRQAAKCAAVEEHMACVETALGQHCAATSATAGGGHNSIEADGRSDGGAGLIRQAVLRSINVAAPECTVSGRDRRSIVPKRLALTGNFIRGDQRAPTVDEGAVVGGLGRSARSNGAGGVALSFSNDAPPPLLTVERAATRSASCLGQPHRPFRCADGRPPTVVRRWARHRLRPACVSYEHALCGRANGTAAAAVGVPAADGDASIAYESDCVDMCFDEHEHMAYFGRFPHNELA